MEGAPGLVSHDFSRGGWLDVYVGDGEQVSVQQSPEAVEITEGRERRDVFQGVVDRWRDVARKVPKYTSRARSEGLAGPGTVVTCGPYAL